ncbi:transposase, partial [Lactobacillus jensenii]|nr:transposase [Lactobacillus jensenii]
CDYRRFSWNLGLETWQNMHEARQLALTQHLKAELKKPRKKQKLTNAEREILANNPVPSWRRIRDELTENKQYWQTK